MDQITDSKIKEAIRLRNMEELRNREIQIDTEINHRISQIQSKKSHFAAVVGILAIGIIILLICLFKEIGFIIGIVIEGAVFLYFWMGVGCGDVDIQIKRIRNIGNAKIRRIRREIDNKTHREIAAYEAEIVRKSQKLIEEKDKIEEMVDYVVIMFQRKVSQADSDIYIRQIKVDFIYEVKKAGIFFYNPNDYTNSQDNFDFKKKRYRNLETDAECEGLARALAELVIQRMRELYQSNLLFIEPEHEDALFTLHFSDINKNFVGSRDIYEADS